MSQQQYEQWCDNMIVIATFYRGDIEFYELVDILEPPADSSEFINSNLLAEWRVYWQPLSDLNYKNIMAIKDTKVEEVKNELEKIRKFFFDNIEKVRAM